MIIKNATPHPVTLLLEDGGMFGFPAAEVTPVPRCEERVEFIGNAVLGGAAVIPVVRKTLGDVQDLPPEQPGVCYIVSLQVAQAAGRPDLLVPNDLVRDKSGRVIGCRSLARVV